MVRIVNFMALDPASSTSKSSGSVVAATRASCFVQPASMCRNAAERLLPGYPFSDNGKTGGIFQSEFANYISLLILDFNEDTTLLN